MVEDELTREHNHTRSNYTMLRQSARDMCFMFQLFKISSLSGSCFYTQLEVFFCINFVFAATLYSKSNSLPSVTLADADCMSISI